MNIDKNAVPSFDRLLRPTMQALQALGGKAPIETLNKKVLQLMNIPSEVEQIPHKDTGSDHRTEMEYRLAWARTYLKQFGLLSNPSPGVWQFTDAYDGDIQGINPSLIVKNVRQQRIETFHAEAQNLHPAEKAMAFERIVISVLKDYAQSIGKPIEPSPASRDLGYDAIMPSGIRDTDQKTYIAVKLSLRAERLSPQLNQIPPDGQLLIIICDTISQQDKQELQAAVRKLCPCAVLIWDCNDLVKETGCELDFTEYLATPKKALVEDVIRNTPSREEKEQIKAARIRSLKEQYQSENVTLFLGAGVSISAGLPLWSTLIHQMFISMVYDKLGGEEALTDAEKGAISQLAAKNQESTPLTQVRYISSALEPDDFRRIMRGSLYGGAVKLEADRLLTSIATLSKPIRTHKGLKSIVTYNFDDLLEQKLSKKEIGYHIISREKDIPDPNMLNIYHVHGYLPYQEDNSIDSGMTLVFSEEDYHELYRDVYSWSNLTQLNAFRETTCLFVGCSLEDPNLRRLLDVYRRSCDNPRHYAILKRKTLEGTDKIQGISPEKLQKYRETDDNIRDNYFASIGINVIWVDDFDEIPNILTQISGERV